MGLDIGLDKWFSGTIFFFNERDFFLSDAEISLKKTLFVSNGRKPVASENAREGWIRKNRQQKRGYVF